MSYIDVLYKERENLDNPDYDKIVNFICEEIISEVKRKVEQFILHGTAEKETFIGVIKEIGWWEGRNTPYAVYLPTKKDRPKINLPQKYVCKLENKVKEEVKTFELKQFDIKFEHSFWFDEPDEYYITFKMTQVRRKKK